MKVWIDLANSPHVPLFTPVVERLRNEGVEVVLTARDHAQTVPLARGVWPDVAVIGGASPPGRVRKAAAIVSRAHGLRRFARATLPDVALSHGSYAQIVAARSARVPAVTMMDYEFQPANHVSFRLAQRVILPAVFPADAARRFGAGERKIVRYEGFKEELYLDTTVAIDTAAALGVDPARVVAVLRPPPEGALYHRDGNDRFEAVLAALGADDRTEIVLLPRSEDQRERYERQRVAIPPHALDGPGLLAAADLVVGGGGTMTREAALLGTPTYTVFMPELAAVDAELIRTGALHDLRDHGLLVVAKKPASFSPRAGRAERSEEIYATIRRTLAQLATR